LFTELFPKRYEGGKIPKKCDALSCLWLAGALVHSHHPSAQKSKLIISCHFIKSHNSSVSIVTGYGLNDQGSWG